MLIFCLHFCFYFKTIALAVSLKVSLAIFCLEVVQNISVLALIFLLHIPSPDASRVSKTFHEYQSGLKKLEENMSCLKAAEVNGGLIELDRARYTQDKTGLVQWCRGIWGEVSALVSCNVIPGHSCQGGVSLQSAVRGCVWCRLFCSTTSELLSLSSLQLFILQFNDVHKLQTHTFALRKNKIWGVLATWHRCVWQGTVISATPQTS